MIMFVMSCESMGIPKPVEEFKFCNTRKFRFDFCWPEHKLALECEGGIFTKQAHGSITGQLRDIEKYNLAACEGYRVLRVVPNNLMKKETFDMIKKCLQIK